MSHPLAIDLFCGLGGWAEGLLAEGYTVVGFDIERHEYWAPETIEDRDDGSKGTRPVAKRGWTQGCAISLGVEGPNAQPRTKLLKYPGDLVIQDVTTLHGSQFKDATLIVASPPCQAYSYRAMPWKKAKALPPPDNTLFETCFRIQREACEAADRHIPMVVENVRGAQKWVGRARWNYGSFYLWGDVPALMPSGARRKVAKAYASPGSWKTTDGDDWRAPANLYGSKQGGDWFAEARKGGKGGTSASFGSKSPARKMASAMIAKIPLPLSRHIARSYIDQRVAA